MSDSVIGYVKYEEISMPDYMVPVMVNEDIVWKRVLPYSSIAGFKVVNELKDKFDSLFSSLKLYIDSFNLTYFCYKESVKLNKESSKPYDVEYGLNLDIKENILKWSKELELFLSKIHPLFIKIKDLLTVKVVY